MNKRGSYRRQVALRLSKLLALVLLLGACNRNEPSPTLTQAAVVADTPIPTETTAPATSTDISVTDTPAATATEAPTATVEATTTAIPAYSINLEAADCQFVVPPDREVECSYLTVPEDRSEPDAGTVRLHVAVFKSESRNPKSDPVVYLEGGPGGDALETVPFIFEQRFSPFLVDRDLIMFDQRGTGYSEPSLACPEYTQLGFDTLEQDLSLEEDVALTLEALSTCRDRLLDAGVKLAAYNSSESAADVNDLRQALGYEQWNLLGISYGTRLAQTIMRDYPEGIRSVVLDSTYPLSASLVVDTPANLDRAFDVFFTGCRSTPSCNEAYPELENTFYELVDRLDAEPIMVPVTYLFTGENYDAVIDGDDMIGILFQSLYATEIIPILPQVITETANGDYQNLRTLLTSFLANSEFSSIGMQFSVQCNEEVPFSQPEEAAEAVTAYPELETFFATSPNVGQTVFTICRNWGAGIADSIENEPVDSAIPALVLAGEYDPITPPAWGALVAQQLDNSHFFTFPGMGHGVSISGECPLSITQAFLGAPTAVPDSSCIDAIAGPNFTVPGAAESEEITLIPFTADLGFIEVAGVVPEGWEEAGPGLYARTESALDQTFILQQAAPEMGAGQLLAVLAGQLGLDGVPETVGTHATTSHTWSLYEGELQGVPVDIAIAEDETFTYVVLLGSTNAEREKLFRAVFLPALEAIHIPE